MADDQSPEAQEAYLNEHLGGGLLGPNAEQVHAFVQAEQANTMGAGFDGGQSNIAAPTSFPGDTDQPSEVHEGSTLGHIAGHVEEHALREGVAHVFEKAAGLEDPIGIFGGLLGMDSDQPKTPERLREEAELEAQKAHDQATHEQLERDHPDMYDMDASVPDATTQ